MAGTATLRFPRLDADAVHALAASVRRHRAEKLARYSTDGIVDVIARAVELWTDPEYPERRLAERLIPAVTGYDASMVRIELKRYMRMFRRRELLRFVDDELNCPQMLDEYSPESVRADTLRRTVRNCRSTCFPAMCRAFQCGA